ncbi:MG284/MPN403 family protein [Mycoplasmopsis bovirhinis]|uniref:MG284/MPN403 family protein n=1 Tax=Mycoplasmopsis bovirhinis TaxID=29553 RepID=UPI0012FD2094|nr:hypothetical protein [Mycoplasmopsis bovirhinis]
MMLEKHVLDAKRLMMKEMEDKYFYNQMCKLLRELFATYLEYKDLIKKQVIRTKLELRFFPHDRHIEEGLEFLEEKLKNKEDFIQVILSYMSSESAWLLKNCYLNNETKDMTEWYLKHFSKTTFYKKKKTAVLEFASYYLVLL